MTVGRWFSIGLLAFCALLTVGLWLAQVNPYLNPADDSGRYMVLGESLAKNGDLRLINDGRQIRDTLYVPGFPAVIAVWLKVTGRDAGGVVLPVKATLLVLLLGTLPLFYLLLERARLSRPTIAAAMVAYASCPALISYANEVMSELPLLFLCLAAIVLATGERRTVVRQERPNAGAESESSDPISGGAGAHDPPALRENGVADDVPHGPVPRSGTSERRDPGPRSVPSPVCIVAALACGVLAYYVRAAGAILLLSLVIWFWRTSGWRWGVATLAVTLLAVGIWQTRSSRIIAQDPPSMPHDTYMKQFTLKDPDKPGAGRIQMNALGIASRIKRCFPPNIGNIPRAVLFSMGSPGTPWQTVFFIVAVPFTLLVGVGFIAAWRRKMLLVCGFCVLFWLFVALWPWINPRFLVPLIPYILLFLFLGAETAAARARTVVSEPAVWALQMSAFALLLIYYGRVHAVVIPREHKATLPGYTLGRSRAEAGFYAAAEWLHGREASSVVMARPPYLMYLYSGHPTTQVEPATRPQVQERAYMLPNHVAYVVADRWTWSHTDNYVGPYLREYASKWTLVWTDPMGSGVRIYRRNDAGGASAEPISG